MRTKTKLKNTKNFWVKSQIALGSIIKNTDNYDEKYMKIKFNSDDKLPLNKTIEIPSMTIVVRAIFLENNKHPQVFLHECQFKI